MGDDERKKSKFTEEAWKAILNHFKKLVYDKICEDMENAQDHGYSDCPTYYRHIRSKQSAKINEHVTKFLGVKKNRRKIAIGSVVENFPESTKREFERQKVIKARDTAKRLLESEHDDSGVFEAWH